MLATIQSKRCASTLPPGSPTVKTNGADGFTLLELLVAVAIFALIGAMAYGGLGQLLSLQARSEQEALRLEALQLAFLHFERDFSQFIARPIRDEFNTLQPPLRGSSERIEFTRSGWDNPLRRPRSTLQRVAYGWRNGVLYREYWQVLDRAAQTQPLRVPLLENLRGVSFRYLDRNQQAHAQWPPLQPATAAELVAVEMVLDITNWGQLRRLFVLEVRCCNEARP